MIICDYRIDYVSKSDPSESLYDGGTAFASRLNGVFNDIKSMVWERNCNGYQLDSINLSIERCDSKGKRIKR